MESSNRTDQKNDISDRGPCAPSKEDHSSDACSRRNWLQLGALALGAFGLSGCSSKNKNGQSSKAEQSTPKKQDDGSPNTVEDDLGFGVDLEKWQKGRGLPYETGDQKMPGVCQLPGPGAKRNWPPKNKYKDAKKIPGMCQLCSTICGIIGYVKEGRLLKVEGNPNDPNSRGKLCARGHASLNHLYHPERLLFPLKRVGEPGRR